MSVCVCVCICVFVIISVTNYVKHITHIRSLYVISTILVMVHFVLLFLIPEKEFQHNETATPKIGQNETEYYELR